jgi:hypothetical protein
MVGFQIVTQRGHEVTQGGRQPDKLAVLAQIGLVSFTPWLGLSNETDLIGQRERLAREGL